MEINQAKIKNPQLQLPLRDARPPHLSSDTASLTFGGDTAGVYEPASSCTYPQPLFVDSINYSKRHNPTSMLRTGYNRNRQIRYSLSTLTPHSQPPAASPHRLSSLLFNKPNHTTKPPSSFNAPSYADECLPPKLTLNNSSGSWVGTSSRFTLSKHVHASMTGPGIM